jgi:hypothetical protein
MATISELKAAHDAAGKKPEELRIRCGEWPATGWFCPMFCAEGKWYGLNADGCLAIWLDLPGDDWHLWQEPKPRKVVYRWVVLSSASGMPITPAYWYDEEGIKKSFPDSKFYHRLFPGRDIETGEVVE